MTSRYPLFVALAGIAAALCLRSARAEDVSALPAPAAAPLTLDALEAAAPKDWKDQAVVIANQDQAMVFIQGNTLQSGQDFFRASNLFSFNRGEYRIGRVQYELLLTATAKGHAEAEKSLPVAYDILMGLLGRPARFDFSEFAQKNPEFAEYEAAPDCIRAVWHDPVAARTAAATSTDNAEVTAIVDADQADRQGNWGARSEEERNATQQRDKARNIRIREIVTAGDLHTADDFARASLVMQHSARFAGYRLAHELAVASLLLGDRGVGRWLVTATYDRMLMGVALNQRFGTQMGPDGPLRVDETGICDNERIALGCPTLAEARTRAHTRQTRPKMVTIAPSVVVVGNQLNDPVNHVSATHPDGWKVIRSSQVDADSTSVGFAIANHPKANALFYYRLKAPAAAPADWEAKLQKQADAKEADRRATLPDYRNRPGSFQFRQGSEQASLRNLADFSHDGVPWCEYLVRIAGPDSYALIAVQVPAEEIGALTAQIDAMAETVRLP